MTLSFAGQFGPDYLWPIVSGNLVVPIKVIVKRSDDNGVATLFTDRTHATTATNDPTTGVATGVTHPTVGLDAAGNLMFCGAMTKADGTPQVYKVVATLPGGDVITVDGLVLTPDAADVASGGDDGIAKTVFEGQVSLHDRDVTGLMVLEAGVYEELDFLIALPAAGGTTTVDIYTFGPGTGWVLSDDPIETASCTAGTHIIEFTGLGKAMQKYDAFVCDVSGVTGTPAGQMTLVARKNPSAVPVAPLGPPTGVTATIVGQPDNTVLVTWTTAPTIPAGYTPTSYTIKASNGQTTTVAYGTNTKQFGSLPADLEDFTVSLGATYGGVFIAGTPSARTTPQVTPTTSVTNRLTANEQKGEDWAAFGGSYAYDPAITVPGSGQTGAAVMTATSDPAVTIGTAGHHSVTVGETKTVEGWFHLDPAASGPADATMWLSFQDSDGDYANVDSPSPQTPHTINPGDTWHYTTTATTPGVGVFAAAAAQIVPNAPGDICWFSGAYWQP